MIKIEIREFKHYDSTSLLTFLLLQNETEFEIIIPREAEDNVDDSYELVIEYLSAAFAGHLLHQIGNCFAYYTPSPNKLVPFNFQVTVSDMEELADTLYYIIQGFEDSDSGETFLDFHKNAAVFLNDAFEEKIDCSTWGLLHIANNYLEQ